MILDVIVLVLALGLIWFRFVSIGNIPPGSSVLPEKAVPSQTAAPKNTVKKPDVAKIDESSEIAVPELPEAKDEKELAEQTSSGKERNIGFTFRHSKAKRVQIIGNFNEWVPQPLSKKENHTWSIAIRLVPGEYAYNFVIDGHPIKDPNNPKICDTGRGFSNSYLKVKPIKNDKNYSK